MSILYKLVAMLCVLALCALNCYSQSGCFVPVAGSAGRSSVDKIYTDPQPGEPAGKFYTTATSYMVSCAPGSSSYATNVVDASPAAGCWVEYKNDGSPTQYPNNYYQNGRVVNFTIQYCPIDDYIPYAFVLFGGLGMILVRKKFVEG